MATVHPTQPICRAGAKVRFMIHFRSNGRSSRIGYFAPIVLKKSGVVRRPQC